MSFPHSYIGIIPPCFLILLLLNCQPKPSSSGNLGNVELEVAGNASAQQQFKKGLLLLHSFEYKDALEAFLKAQKEDPECVMAYWGEAMTYHHPIWQEQDFPKGKETLLKLGETKEIRLAMAESDLERDLLAAVEILYGEGTKTERDKSYARHFGALYEKYPKQDEITTFYALALMGSVPYVSDMEIYQKAASLAEEVMERNPEHPGAIHYFIHANDEPNYAMQAKKAADIYAKVAPDAAHALHMPSHIYLSLGLWDDVVASNEESFQASVQKKKEIRNLDYNALGFHSFHWLQYGYLQQERMEDARKLLEDIALYTRESPSSYSRGHQIFMKTTYLIESDDWDNPLAELKTSHEGLNIATISRDRFVHALKAYHKGDFNTVEEILSKMEEERSLAAKTISLDAGIALCASGGAKRENATPRSLHIAEVMEMELKALLAKEKGDWTLAEEWFKKATALEEKVGSAAGPPVIVKPSHELYAEFLISLKREKEAILQYETALKLAPNRLKSVKGIKHAQEELKHQVAL